jgi:hypothetical protein
LEQKQLFQQVIELNQATLNNVFDAMALLQDRFENIANGAMDLAPGLPDKKRQAIKNWAELFKDGRDNMQQHMNYSFEQVEKLFTIQKKTLRSDFKTTSRHSTAEALAIRNHIEPNIPGSKS